MSARQCGRNLVPVLIFVSQFPREHNATADTIYGVIRGDRRDVIVSAQFSASLKVFCGLPLVAIRIPFLHPLVEAELGGGGASP